MIGFPQIGQTAPFSAWGAGVAAGAPWRLLGACLVCPWVFSLGRRSLAALGRLGRSLDPFIHVEADVPVPVDDHKVDDLPAVVVGDARDLEAGVRIAFQDFLPAVLLAFGIELIVRQFDVNEGAGIKFAADPDVEAGALEGVGRLAFLFLGVAFDADVLFPDPGALLCVPDVDIAEQVPVDDFVGSLPVPRAEDLVQNPHIDPRVLVKQQDRADLAGLRSADALDPTFDVLFRQKGDFLLDGRRGHGGRRRVLGGFGGRGGRLRHLSGRLFLCHVIRPLYLI